MNGRFRTSAPFTVAVPLRTNQQRLEFCDQYFAGVGARTVHESSEYREYELPRDVDKELTDRPFYWMWVEQTNQDVPPTILRLAFSPEALDRENARLKKEALEEAEKKNLTDVQRMFFRPPTAELVTLGSFRLDKIYASLKHRARFGCVAPRSRDGTTFLIPWLMINATISYRCDLVEQDHVSVGICLANGQIVDGFYGMIHKIAMSPETPSRLMMSAKLKVNDGFERCKEYLETQLSNRSHDWASSAQLRLHKEVKQLRTYYQSILPDIPEDEKTLVQAEQARKERELIQRSQPRIEITLHQVGLVGLMER